MARSKMIRRENLSQGACIVQLHKEHQLGGRKSPSERMQQDQGAIRKKGFDLQANCKIRHTMEKIELSASTQKLWKSFFLVERRQQFFYAKAFRHAV
jgi:hypothetical protein